MSKASELRLIRGQRSADAPISYHHRSGDSEGSGGSMLDYYAQEESAEAAYLEEEDESAREVFSRAFKLYLKKTLTGKERQFLSRVLSGKEKPQDVGRALGVKWFEYLQAIQRKAFNNAEAFGRVVQLSGWSRAEEFSSAVFARLRHLQAAPKEAEELPREKKQARARAMMKAFRESADEERRAAKSFYRAAHREERNEYNKRYWAEHREECRAYFHAYEEAHREERNARRRELRARNREETRAKDRALRARLKERDPIKYAEQKREKNRRYLEANAEKLREWRRQYREANAEKERERSRKYREANREKDLKRKREYREKKKAEKAAAQALAGLLILTQTQEAETSESVSAIE